MINKFKTSLKFIFVLTLTLLLFGCGVFNKEVESISFFINEETINNGDVLDFQFEIEPKSAEYENLYLDFNDDTLVTQDKDGKYIAAKDGVLKATIMCDGKAFDMKIINIKPIKVESITTNNIELGIDRTYIPEINYFPLNSTHKDYSIVSGDTDIAKIKDNKIIGVSEGTTTLTIQSVDGPKTECSINVFEVVPEKILIQKIKSNIITNDQTQLNIIYKPSDVTNKIVKWSSSNPNVLQVENGLITAKNPGKATITAVYSDGIYDSLDFNVSYPPVSSISLEGNSNSMYVGNSLRLKTTYTPEKVDDASLEWESSNEEIAVVDQNGQVTAKRTGDVTIKATSANNKHATIDISITKAPVVAAALPIVTQPVYAETTSEQTMVWLSATGSKYHSRNNCYPMNPERAKQATLEEAIYLGYEACSKCYHKTR